MNTILNKQKKVFGFLTFLVLLVSFIWSLIELYRLRRLRIRILAAMQNKGDVSVIDYPAIELGSTKYYPDNCGPFTVFVEK